VWTLMNMWTRLRSRSTLRVLLTVVGSVGLLAWIVAGILAVRYYALAGPPGSPTPEPSPTGGTRAAEVYAAQFAAVYLSYDSAHPEDYRKAVSPYLARGLDPMAGWDGKGAESHPLAEIPVSSSDEGGVTVVTMAVQLGDQRWMTLAIPVATSDEGGGMAISALPTLVAGPHHADWSAVGDHSVVDTAATVAAIPSLKAFFAAYAAGNQTQITTYTMPGRVIQGLGGEVTMGNLVDVRVAQGSGAVRSASATVAWHDKQSGATFRQTYRLGLTPQGRRWLVAWLAPAQ
jgi:hypothetical protein